MKLENKNFRNLFHTKSFSWSMISLSAFLYTIGFNVFLNTITVFSSGLGAFASIFGFIFPAVLPFFSLIYLGLNIPLMIYYRKTLKKQFLLKTGYFLILQTLLSLPLILSSQGVISFNFLNYFAGLILNIQRSDNILELSIEGWPIVVLSLIGATIVGFSIAISWKFGGSTGGTDFIVYYYTTKKQKNIGSFIFIVSLIILAISFTITTTINPEITPGTRINDRLLLRLSSTIMYVIIVSMLVNIIYPKYSKVRVSVVTKKNKQLIAKLKKMGYHHSYSTREETSGFTGKQKYIIESVMYLLEEREFVKIVQGVCDDAWISSTPVTSIHGALSTKKIEAD